MTFHWSVRGGRAQLGRMRVALNVATLALVGLGLLHAVAAKSTGARAVSGVVSLSARPVDENRPFETVLFFLDDECIYSTNAEPFGYDWDTRQFPEGRHLLKVEAYHRTARVAWSRSIPVIIANESAGGTRGEGAAIELPFSTAERTRPEFVESPPAKPSAKSPLARALLKPAAPAPKSVAPPLRSSAAAASKLVRQPSKPAVAARPPSVNQTEIRNAHVAARESVTIFLDGKDLQLGEITAPPDREILYLPARGTFARLGAQGMWSPETQTFFAKVGEKKVWLTTGDSFVRINRIPRDLEAPIRLDSERGLQIPVGVCRHAFDLRVVWVHDTGRVELFTEQRRLPVPVGSPLGLLFSLFRTFS